MNVASLDLERVLGAHLLLFLASHICAHLARKICQPAVIGEIFGGLILGPTVFGWLAPEAQASLFDPSEGVGVALNLFYQFGLLLLMFLSGIEVERIGDEQRQLRLSGGIAVTGSLIPVALCLVVAPWLPLEGYMGEAQDKGALVIIFALAISVTSRPVLSKIFMDLGLMNCRLAKLVITSSILDDFFQYVLLALALNRAGSGGVKPEWIVALTSNLGPISKSLVDAVVQSFFIVSCLTWLRPVLGAFAAGLLATRLTEFSPDVRSSLRAFSFSFFVPVFFALVGFRLNLVRDFDAGCFAVFLAVATAVKMLSIYAGARLVGIRHKVSMDLSITLNARGGPGIVLASAAADAGIIDARLYVNLALLALVTSSITGAWLEISLKKGRLDPNDA